MDDDRGVTGKWFSPASSLVSAVTHTVYTHPKELYIFIPFYVEKN